MIFSCVIPAKDPNDPKLKDLLASIRAQDFPQDQIETIVVTEGDSEQAKAIGIRQAKGEICAMFCADNYITSPLLFRKIYYWFGCEHRNCRGSNPVGVYLKHYDVLPNDNSLNRYFSLIGVNDPITFYLGKADRSPAYDNDKNEILTEQSFEKSIPSFGDNGFFINAARFKTTNLDHYYPMDNCEDLRRMGWSHYRRLNGGGIWHRTSDNLLSFLIKRYKYARDLYCDRTDRRWRMVETNDDIRRLCWFGLACVLVIPCLLISIRGFSKIKDPAWFWHWPVCFGFLITYSILAIRNLFTHGVLFQKRPSLSPRLAAAPS